MTTESTRADVLSDLLEEHGVSLTREQVESLSRGFAGHIDMEREMESYQFSGPTTCQACAEKQKRISELEERGRILEQGVIRYAKVPRDCNVLTEHGHLTIQEPMRLPISTTAKATARGSARSARGKVDSTTAGRISVSA